MTDPIRYPIRTTVTALVIAAAAAYPGEAAERDCAPGEVHADVDRRPLTSEEKIARMDEALRESLARFDECQAAASVSADGGSGVEGAQGNAAGGGGSGRPVAGDGATAQADGTVESVAAEGVQGTETPEEAGATAQADGTVESVAAEGVRGTEAPEEAGGTAPGSEPPTSSGGVRSDTSGDIPEDIPDPDNDSVLEAQIRRAAMEETDPRIRAELWNEYRKYKGLPARPLPDDDGEPSDAQISD